ncbi:Fc.00g037160.m01.CDS01 [Cosmosporella sp. VM-42]
MSALSDDVLKSFGNLGLNKGLRLIVGFDFGTTYSGIAWVLSNRTSADQIEVMNNWPDNPSQLPKAPSTIAYACENSAHRAKEDKWGYSVRGGMKSYLWTKLLLDETAVQGQFDDPSLKEYFGSGLMTLPSGKSAQKVCSEYMACLYKHFVNRIQQGNKVSLDITPMEVWLTVPAIWGDLAKQRTLDAAKEAGFGSRTFLGDTISIIAEPEAAALTILKPRLDSTILSTVISKNILVCDCGGGTVDIVCYTITSAKGRARFKELCLGTGAKCGSTAIDRAFHKWMTKRFGSAYNSVPRNSRGPGSKFMHAFESAKRNFDGSDEVFEIYPINMTAPASDEYDKPQGTVMLSGGVMQTLFDPVVDDIIKLVDEQVARAMSKKGEKIQEIFLVGGFGDSLYLNKRMKQYCSGKGMSVSCPPKCQAAIATGAALRGLFGLKPDSRVCRRHYGYDLALDFREGIDDEDDAYIWPLDNSKLCMKRTKWVAKKNQNVDDNTTAHHGLCWPLENYTGGNWSAEIEFYYSEWDDAPDSIKHWSVYKLGEIKLTFLASEISKCAKTWNNKLKKNVIKVECTVQVDLNADTGRIEFRTMIGDREAGYTNFEYDKEK